VQHACRTRAVEDPETRVRLTEKQQRTLQQLDVVDPVMVTELAEYLGVTASTMSLNLGRLEDAGLVRRARDPVDRRVMNVYLTEEGARLRTHTASLAPARVAVLLDELRPEDRRRVLEGLALLAEAADAVAKRGEAYLEALAGSVRGDPPATFSD
jgi:DNA-binding MarR family transcriptional regulator